MSWRKFNDKMYPVLGDAFLAKFQVAHDYAWRVRRRRKDDLRDLLRLNRIAPILDNIAFPERVRT